MKILITQDVDGMSAGEIHDLRDGYALGLINANKATDVPENAPREVVLDPAAVVETTTEAFEVPGGYVELTEDDDE